MPPRAAYSFPEKIDAIVMARPLARRVQWRISGLVSEHKRKAFGHQKKKSTKEALRAGGIPNMYILF